ncbi:MAG: hypothetical protein ACXWT3_01610 [Methylococcaceae bacterium]
MFKIINFPVIDNRGSASLSLKTNNRLILKNDCPAMERMQSITRKLSIRFHDRLSVLGKRHCLQKTITAFVAQVCSPLLEKNND